MEREKGKKKDKAQQLFDTTDDKSNTSSIEADLVEF